MTAILAFTFMVRGFDEKPRTTTCEPNNLKTASPHSEAN